MIQVRNINNGVIKKLQSEVEVSMYLATKEWALVKPNKNDSLKEEKNGEK